MENNNKSDSLKQADSGPRPTPILRVRDWSTSYENNRTRELKSLAWVPIPNAHDTDAYLTLIDRPNGAGLFGAWIALLKVASRSEPRGTLLRSPGVPHDATSLHRVTRIPADIFKDLIAVATSECGLLEIVDADVSQHDAIATHPPATVSQPSASLSHEAAPNERTNEANITKGTEQKRTEPNESDSVVRSGDGGKSNNGIVALSSSPDRTTELLRKCHAVLGRHETEKNKETWRKRAEQDPVKLEKVLDDMQSQIKEGKPIRNRGAFATDLWTNRFA